MARRSRVRSLQKVSLVEQASAAIRELIVTGHLRQGERLTERQLSEDLAVSRGTIREAISQLHAEGLVKLTPHQGARVSSLTSESVSDVYELRRAIESLAAARVAGSADESVLRILESCVARLRALARRGERKAMARADLDFHEAVCQLSGNASLLRAFQTQAALLQPLLVAEARSFYDDLETIAEEHIGLLDALRSGSVERARHAFEEHLEMSRRNVVAFVINSHPEGQEDRKNLSSSSAGQERAGPSQRKAPVGVTRERGIRH